MKIIDDKIQFDAADIAALSKRLQDAATFRAGSNNLPAENYLSARFNAILDECLIMHERDLLAQHPKIFLAFSFADADTQVQIKKILGITDDANPQLSTNP